MCIYVYNTYVYMHNKNVYRKHIQNLYHEFDLTCFTSYSNDVVINEKSKIQCQHGAITSWSGVMSIQFIT